ncbi:MAG: FAD:protein FMN transferase [Pseudomonadota bacterium]
MKNILVISFVFILAACSERQATFRLNGETMGTTYTVVASQKNISVDEQEIREAIEETLSDVDSKLSNWAPLSEISRFNAAKHTNPVPISRDLALVLSATFEVHEQSSGHFDVTLGPLIELWGFGVRQPDSPVPADAEISKALEYVGLRELVELGEEGTSLRKVHPEVSINLAPLAKGYGIDAVAQTLTKLGFTNYMVEIGGDLVVSGLNPEGQQWHIGIERPEAIVRTVEQVVVLSDAGMATSGDYRNYFEDDDIRYSHILDVKTGRPVTHKTASVTVVAENAMMADAWATALLAMGRPEGMKIAKKFNLAAFFIERDVALDSAQEFVVFASPRFNALNEQQ